MRKPYLLVVFVAVLWALFARWFYVHHIKTCPNCDAPKTIETPKTLALFDDGKNVFGNFEAFDFDLNSSTPKRTDDNQLLLQKIADYLKDNSKKKLHITGVYRANAENNVPLGIARAKSIANIFTQIGLDTTRLIYDSKPIADKQWTGGIAFDIENAVITEQDLQAIVISDANFESNSDVFVPTDDFVRLCAALKNYVAQRPSTTMTIIGHTDNQGADVANLALGLRRANAVKQYFEQQGVAMVIKTTSKGESNPIADNATDEGRAKNRRVETLLATTQPSPKGKE